MDGQEERDLVQDQDVYSVIKERFNNVMNYQSMGNRANKYSFSR